MNNYQRLEVNLLPPEMAPSPAVRGSVILSWIIVVVALLFIGVDAFLEFNKISQVKAKIAKQDADILAAKPFEDEWASLNDIAQHTEGRGKLVGMTTASYVEYPIVMDRIARILPEGVYLVKAGSSGTSRGSSEMNMELRTSTGDPELMQRTLEAFKASSMFANVYLRTGDFAPETFDEVSKNFNVGYKFDGPGNNGPSTVDSYDFELRASVKNPLEVDDLPVIMDNSDYMTQFTLTTDPNAAQTGTAKGVAKPGTADSETEGGAAPAAPAAPAAGGAAPAGGGN